MELLAPAEKTEGGLYLPERSQWNDTDAIVLACGPGSPIPGTPYNQMMWADPGDRVLFTHHAWHTLGPPHRIGWVEDSALVGMIRPNGAIVPLNDWVLIEQDPDIRDASPIVTFAAEYRPKPCSGIIQDYGPGLLLESGPYAGHRRPVPQIMGLATAEELANNDPSSYESKILGKRCYWSRSCEMLSLGNWSLECLLVQADDLLFFSEDD